ncbi:MAG: CBS domain-containing protein [Spirochaetaceae bacterium]|nr:CBS domain-containing protein [Spirochaetaceae bacterium]
MQVVKDILKEKGNATYGIGPEATLLEALEMMADRNIGAVLVVGDDGRVKGIFSERDLARKIIIKGRSIEATKVKDIMTSQVIYVDPTTSVQDCMNLMTAKRIRHLPVMEGDAPVGLISIGDVVRALLKMQDNLIHQKDFEIGQLERVITQSP